MFFDIYVISATKAVRLTIIFVNHVDEMLIKASRTSGYTGTQIRECFEGCISLWPSRILLPLPTTVQSVGRGTLCISASFVLKLANLHASSIKNIFWCKLKVLYFGISCSGAPNGIMDLGLHHSEREAAQATNT